MEVLKDGWWTGVVKIDGLTIVAPEVTSLLFDIDNLKAVKPIAARKGLPKTLSFEAEHAIEEDKDSFGETWLTPNELNKAFEVKEVKEGWSLIFYMMDTLVAIYGEDRVRLVVWFV